MKQLLSILLMLTLGAPTLWAQDKHSETYIRERIDAIYDKEEDDVMRAEISML